jgi:hypothetical protein
MGTHREIGSSRSGDATERSEALEYIMGADVPQSRSPDWRLSMEKFIFAAALVAICIPGTVAAQNVFDGTWKLDIGKFTMPEKPDEFYLVDGVYECRTCDVPFKVKADGTDQPISGNPYVDTVAIKVVNDHEVEETDKKGGKTVATATFMISPDGNTLMVKFSDSSNTNGGPPMTGNGQSSRVAKGPVGSHLVSGSWRMSKVDNMSDNATTWSYKVNGGEITMSSATGQTYTAKLDGTEASMRGDPGIDRVSVKLIGTNTLEETDYHNGKVVVVFKMTVEADGKTANIIFDDRLSNRTNGAVAIKQ